MSNVLLLRLNDSPDDDLIAPRDELGNLADLTPTGAAPPAIVEAATGFGRLFVPVDARALQGKDAAGRSTLLQRDMSVQTILRWDFAAAVAYGLPQALYVRGKGDSAAEYIAAGLELRVVNAGLHIGEVRWFWQDLAGTYRFQSGGHFQLPPPNTDYVMITATRRWVSSTRVVLRYYLGDALLAEVESPDGVIGGGTTGTTILGSRYVVGTFDRFFGGTLDELRVVDEELSQEEIAATWNRITVEQPKGYKLLRDLHDPGFPISDEPTSAAQRETRLYGHGLGFASAQAENMRDNLPPDRAYGRTLEQWEEITKVSRLPGDSIDQRRKRVVGKIRQKRGISIPGIEDAIGDLVDMDPAMLELRAFDQTVYDTWSTLNPLRWRHKPAAPISIASNRLRHLSSATARSTWRTWITSLVAAGGDGQQAAIAANMYPATIASGADVGLAFLDRGRKRGILVGLRNNGGTYELATSIVTEGVAAPGTVLATPGLVPLAIILEHVTGGDYRIRWGASFGPAMSSANILATGVPRFQWAGFYARTVAGTPTIDVTWDNSAVYTPNGDRSFFAYVRRDPSIPGASDDLGAEAVLQGLRQAHTEVHLVRTFTAKCDDPDTTCDATPMGGI